MMVNYILEKLYKTLYKCNFEGYGKYKLSSFFYKINFWFLLLIVLSGFLSIYIKIFQIIQIFFLGLQFICFCLQVFADKKWNKKEVEIWNELQTDFDYIAFINTLLEENGFDKSDKKYAYWYILSNEKKLTKDEIKTFFMHFKNHFHTIKFEYEHNLL